MSWHMVRVRTREREKVAAALFASGALALQEQADGVTTHFPTEAAAGAAAEAARQADQDARVEITPTVEPDYSRWKAAVQAWEIGRLTVAPPWLATGRDPETTVLIDPAMAFGTGEHATTRGSLLLLQRVLRPGDTVADLGTGSGVLAIAAAKMGATRVFGIEHDPDAVANAEANVKANLCASVVTILTGDARTLLPLVAPVRLVLANIASLALLQLLPLMHAALTADGAAVISGVLVSEAETFRSGMDGWRIVEEYVEGDWWTAAIARL